jgi:hypothetical protein
MTVENTNTHWRVTIGAGGKRSKSVIATCIRDALPKVLAASNAHKISIVEGKHDGHFFTVRYGLPWPRTYTINRTQAKAIIAGTLELPNYSPFAKQSAAA